MQVEYLKLSNPDECFDPLHHPAHYALFPLDLPQGLERIAA